MVRRLNTKDKNFAADFEALLFARRDVEEDVAGQVKEIIADVRKRGFVREKGRQPFGCGLRERAIRKVRPLVTLGAPQKRNSGLPGSPLGNRHPPGGGKTSTASSRVRIVPWSGPRGPRAPGWS